LIRVVQEAQQRVYVMKESNTMGSEVQRKKRTTSIGRLVSRLASLALIGLAGCNSATETAISPGSGKLPVSFIVNAGQTDASVHFQARALGGMAFFTSGGPTLSVPRSQTAPTRRDVDTSETSKFKTLRVRYEGANAQAKVSHGEKLPGVANFLIGDDPSAWHTNVPTYAGIVYEDLYPNIRVRYEGIENNLESTIEVAPFADPSLVKWKYDGALSQHIDEKTGNLVVVVGHAERDGEDGDDTLVETAPIAWQTIHGENMLVDVRFRLDEHGAAYYQLGEYDHSLPLVIDPAIIYNTFLGSSTTTNGRAMALDAGGNTYITGDTSSSTLFPNPSGKDTTYNGGQDVFVAKLDANGSNLLYSTYLGNAGEDIAYDIAVDGQQQAWVVGATKGTWPLKLAAQGFRAGIWEGFVTKLNATGTDFVFSSYHGGLTAGNGDDYVYAVAVDSSGNGHVTGSTTSTNFHTTANAPFLSASGGNDAFYTSWSSTGARTFGTYLGGSGSDIGRAISTTPWGYVLIAGETASANFGPAAYGGADMTANGGIDGFVVSFSGSSIESGSYIGGPQDDVARGVAVDNNGYAYVVGDTTSTTFPFGAAYQLGTSGGKDVFVAKTDYGAWGAYSLTRLAGPQDDVARGIAIDSSNNLFITGSTASPSFGSPSAPTYVFGARSGSDIFVTKMTSGATVSSFNTILGGNGTDDGYDVAVNAAGIYVAGTSTSSNYPVAAPPGLFAYDTALAGGTSPVVTKIATTGSSLQFSTYLDGIAAEEANAVATVGNAVFIAGSTTSAGFPSSPGSSYAGGSNDAFVTKLDSLSNSMLYSTFIGGTDADFATGISVDSMGQATVVGYSRSSTGFPNFNVPTGLGAQGNYDAFLSRLNSAGNGLTTSFRFGGAASDYAQDVALDGSGQAIVVGQTASVDFPVTNGVLQQMKGMGNDAFVARINLSGATPVFTYKTFLGGLGNDIAYGVATDSMGNAFVTGGTTSSDFPLMSAIQSTPGGSNDVFVSKIMPDGSALVFSTYLGGTGSDIGRDIAVDAMGNVNVVGESQSDWMLETWPALIGLRTGGTDGLFIKISSDGTQIPFWTYFGGTGDDYLNGVAVNSSTGVATFVGTTGSSNLPTFLAVPQGTNLKGATDAFVGRIDDTSGIPDFTFLSYLGGSSYDYGRDVALIGDDAVVVGVTNSSNFALNAVAPGADSTYNGESDAFMTRIDL